jgi:predicted DNA-binding protein (MmcQ/YjbR family)
MDRQAIRAACLAFPAAMLDHPWGEDHDAYKVGGKMFAIVGGTGGLSFKASRIAFEVLTETGRARPAPYLARAGWLHLDDPDAWPDEELADHLRVAHALVASKLPKKLRTELGLA